MIGAIVESAFQTGCLSVEAEGVIRQLLSLKLCQPVDLDALKKLYQAMQNGDIRREAPARLELPCIEQLQPT